jgi:hypothetical protein
MQYASSEQLEIVRTIAYSNIIVDAVAGSGKTTTILYMAQEYKDKSILLLTYNRRLRHETITRCSEYDIDNIECHTYHSFCYKYIGPECCKDSGIYDFLTRGQDYLHGLDCPVYDIIVLDECQDLTRLLYKLITVVVRDSTLCIIGDMYQNIYTFAQADHRYMTCADSLFTTKIKKWSRLTLSTSYRATRPIANFINTCVLGFDRLNAVKNGPRVRYTIMNMFKPNSIVNEILVLIRMITSSEIFILAPSVRSTNPFNPVNRLANSLTDAQIPIHIPSDDNVTIDEDTVRHKVVFSSFHQAKGLERKAVIVLGFDSSYFAYYYKNTRSTTVCPSTLYVALTRASLYLSVYHNSKCAPLDFINMDNIRKHTVLRGGVIMQDKSRIRQCEKYDVRALCRHIPSNLLVQILQYLNYRVVQEASDIIDIERKTVQTYNGYTIFEDTTAINKMVVYGYYQYMTTGSITIMGKNIQGHIPPHSNGLVNKIVDFYSKVSGLTYIRRQINTCDWVDDETLQCAYTRLCNELGSSNTSQYSTKILVNIDKYIITGYVDMLDAQRAIELKMTPELTTDSLIQLAIIAYELSKTKVLKYQIYNIYNSELVELEFCPKVTEKIIMMLIHHKASHFTEISDTEFISMALEPLT